jgi:hypothetical protein
LAGTFDKLTLRQAALLLRCQRSREEQRLIGAMRADHAHTKALAAEASTRDRLNAHLFAQARQIAAAHEEVRGQRVDFDTLQRLTILEERLRNEATTIFRELLESREAVGYTEQALGAARTALQADVRVTRKRTRLLEALQTEARRAIDDAEEAELDDWLTDHWTSS